MGAPYAELNLGRDHQGVAVIIPITNMIESLHIQLRKIIKNRGQFPSDEAAIKLL